MFNIVAKPEGVGSTLPIEPTPYKRREIKDVRICTFDTETDPFALDDNGEPVDVKPFTCGFYDGTEYHDFWGRDCVDQFFGWLMYTYVPANPQVKLVVYCHNFGNFDFYFCTDYWDEGTQPFIINGRMAKCQLGGVEFRDSYALIPVGLDKYQKDKIDYATFVPEKRELHKPAIRRYQRSDCIYLHELVSAAYEEFGDKLTMASVALPMLRSYHGFETLSERLDAELRPFFFGGRTECFEVGELRPAPGKAFQVVDVNSMYPAVMAECDHPISGTPKYQSTITARTDFAKIEATSYGALPVREEDGSLSFPHTRGIFYATIHEIKAGLELGLLRIHRVFHSIYFDRKTKFDTFIHEFFARRDLAKSAGDLIRDLFWKLIMNSSYGKFAQDPRRYEEYVYDPEQPPSPFRCNDCAELSKLDARPDLCADCTAGISHPEGWRLHTVRSGHAIYSRPSPRRTASGFYNVATAASITGAARAKLLRGLASAIRPLYCDTDSIICEGFVSNNSVTIDDRMLGAWKVEAVGDTAAIGGKKLYAVFNSGEAIKLASKGVKLTADEIRRVCRGETITYRNPVPKFNLDGANGKTVRNVSRTGSTQVAQARFNKGSGIRRVSQTVAS